MTAKSKTLSNASNLPSGTVGERRFPKGFLFGATIGAHQVEGADYESDWWRWEQRPTRIRDGQTSALGAGHLERYREDLSLARKLGLNSICLSLSWARIMPESGRFNEDALAHYTRVFEQAREGGLQIVCVMHQVSQPRWFSDQGGWSAKDAPARFHTYAEMLVKTLGPLCDSWIPIYEPEFWLTLACREGRWPSAGSGPGLYRRNMAGMAHAQHLATQAVHDADDAHSVGMSVRGAIVEPMDHHSPWDTRAALYEQRRLNMRFIEALTERAKEDKPFDFIGLSYYGKTRVRFAPLYRRGNFALPVNEKGEPSSLDEPLQTAEGIEEALASFARLGVPLMLTGLGIATNDDAERRGFIRDAAAGLLNSMHLADAVPDVRGLFYTSLLDGFEWLHGYTRHCGLVHVKHPGMSRTPNQSAWFFKDIAEHGCLRPGALRQFCDEGDSQ